MTRYYPSRVVLRDDSLPHQIRIYFSRPHLIAVSCNCLKQGSSYMPLGERTRWEPHEPMALWRKHMAEVEAA